MEYEVHTVVRIKDLRYQEAMQQVLDDCDDMEREQALKEIAELDAKVSKQLTDSLAKIENNLFLCGTPLWLT